MCGEYNLKGVLVATKSKDGRKACTIPKSCEGKMVQTTFLTQADIHIYIYIVYIYIYIYICIYMATCQLRLSNRLRSSL